MGLIKSSLLTTLFLFGATNAASLPPSTLSCILNIKGLKSSGSITTKGSANYSSLATPFNERLTAARMPGIIVTPTTIPQIQSVVRCASKTNPPASISARSGGHSYAAYGLSGDIVIDLRNFKGIKLDKNDNTVTIQTGNRLGDVATAIFEQGGRALPHGSCPYVGVGGHTLYGGFGWFSRVGGLLVDVAASAEVILANGTLTTLSNAEGDQDLWWAIRGGGPSFGLVISWRFKTLPAPKITTRYSISYKGAGAPNLSVDKATKAYTMWEGFAAQKGGQPGELAMAADFFAANVSGMVQLSFGGNWYGDGGMAEAQKVLQNLKTGLGSEWEFEMHEVGWIQGLIELSGKTTLDTSAPDVPDNFFAKSLITTKPSSAGSVKQFVEYLATKGQTSDTAWFVQVDLYGANSKISRTDRDFNAFAHRDAFVVWQFYASKESTAAGYPQDGIPFVNGMVKVLEPNPTGAYPNYIDPTLQDGEWERLYFGEHTRRLETVKSRVDRENVYRLVQGF